MKTKEEILEEWRQQPEPKLDGNEDKIYFELIELAQQAQDEESYKRGYDHGFKDGKDIERERMKAIVCAAAQITVLRNKFGQEEDISFYATAIARCILDRIEEISKPAEGK